MDAKKAIIHFLPERFRFHEGLQHLINRRRGDYRNSKSIGYKKHLNAVVNHPLHEYSRLGSRHCSPYKPYPSLDTSRL